MTGGQRNFSFRVGKSRESQLNTRCWRQANRVPDLCAPTTHGHTGSRDPFTPADPLLPTHTPLPHLRAPRLHLLVPHARAHRDRVHAAPTDPEAAPHGRGVLAGRAASVRGAHHSTIALGPRPGVLTLRPVAATAEPRTEQGSLSSRLEESGAAGHWAGWGTW
ncbi:unnamed protein product [Rangifer tarandus platyrhynchus]|uniref:Uncharacterized protein n=1 Tax=Rangifer tarandus platyrhynchus TaxID=3082113 RepID=A0ABN8XRW0_RANTA|nr:unnamed protein product [Rangifer tarandus platyrhynchus]CAI9689960.1 unnamed protein product [Rangifer tarandus platyrhynchus]